MRLGLRILDPNSTVNNLMYLNQLELFPGESSTVLLQLVDLNSATESNQRGIRYMPAPAATATAIVKSVNSAKTLNKILIQPFAQDPSIWQFSLSTADTQMMSGVNIELTLTEGAEVKIARGLNVIIMSPSNPYQC